MPQGRARRELSPVSTPSRARRAYRFPSGYPDRLEPETAQQTRHPVRALGRSLQAAAIERAACGAFAALAADFDSAVGGLVKSPVPRAETRDARCRGASRRIDGSAGSVSTVFVATASLRSRRAVSTPAVTLASTINQQPIALQSRAARAVRVALTIFSMLDDSCRRCVLLDV